jgi:glycosyltransferase involved in cell wall biosynthesis
MTSSPQSALPGVRERPLAILLVGTQMALGGAQRLLLDQARWFHDHGHRVAAAFFYDKQGLSKTWGEAAAYPLVTLGHIGTHGGLLAKAFGLLSALIRLWRLLRREKFDVVESFTYDSNLLALPLAWLARVPVRIATHHGIIEGFPRILERLHSASVNAGVASKLVNVSRKVLEQAAAAGIRREHMTVIPNGIPPMEAIRDQRSMIRGELGLANDAVLILSVGRLVYQKGHEYLIQAMQTVARQLPSARAVICGDGPLRDELEAEVARMGLDGRVHLLGNRLDIGRYLIAADLFVLPSRWEGLPVALLEAMDTGLPIVATRVEGVEEVIQTADQGALVPPEDARALAASICALGTDPERRRHMGVAARARVRESYTTDIMCEKYLSLMRNLLPRRAR